MDSNSIKQALAEIREIETEWKKKANNAAKEVCREIGMQIIANLDYIPWTDEFKNTETHEIIQVKNDIGVWDLTET